MRLWLTKELGPDGIVKTAKTHHIQVPAEVPLETLDLIDAFGGSPPCSHYNNLTGNDTNVIASRT